MNVANRKLFANRDARKKLAEMGGILASSPELLGEAMKFAEAGQVDVQMYVINVPGLTAPGEYLKVSEETLMQLNDIVPQLMSQQETLVEPAEAVEGLVDVRPGDALLPKRLRDIGALPDQAPVPTVQEPVDDLSVSPPGRYGLGDAIDAINEMGLGLGETLANTPGVISGKTAREKLGPNQPGVSFSQLMSPPTYNMTGFGGGAEPAFSDRFPGRDSLDPQPVNVPQYLSDLGAVPTEVDGETLYILPTGTVYSADGKQISGGKAMQAVDVAQRQGSDFTKAPEGLTIPLPLVNKIPLPSTIKLGSYETDDSGQTLPDTFSPLSIPLADTDAPNQRMTEATQTADAERLQMSGFPDATYLGGLTEQIFENKADVTKFLALNAEQLKKKKQAAEKGDGTDTATDDKGDGTTPPPPADDDKTDKILKMSTAEATNEYYKSLKELFGLSDEDKARDLSLTMAQFGFAMAAGQSPNALTNIANAAGAALAQMRESQATEREREDKLKLLAFTEARADEKEARELDRLEQKRLTDIKDALYTYEEKQKIAQKYETEKEPQWLKDMQDSWESTLTDLGGDPGAALEAFKKIYSPEAVELWMMSRKMLTGGGTNPTQKRDLSVIQ